jgi:hypothetical protein
MPFRRPKTLPHVLTDFSIVPSPQRPRSHFLLPQFHRFTPYKMNPSPNAPYSYEPFSCHCDHTIKQHALARCGHPNDRPPTHPLYVADDALHRVWCTECKAWCFSKRDDCPIFKDPHMKLGDGGLRRRDDASSNGNRNRNETCARM